MTFRAVGIELGDACSSKASLELRRDRNARDANARDPHEVDRIARELSERDPRECDRIAWGVGVILTRVIGIRVNGYEKDEMFPKMVVNYLFRLQYTWECIIMKANNRPPPLRPLFVMSLSRRKPWLNAVNSLSRVETETEGERVSCTLTF